MEAARQIGRPTERPPALEIERVLLPSSRANAMLVERCNRVAKVIMLKPGVECIPGVGSKTWEAVQYPVDSCETMLSTLPGGDFTASAAP